MWSGITKYPVRSAIIALIGLVATIGGWVLVHSLFSSVQTISAGVENTSVWSGSQGAFMFLAILVGVIFIGYYLKKSYWPHPAIIAGVLGTILINWLWWSIHPESWSEWRNSNAFWPVTFALIFVAVMWSMSNNVSKLATRLLVIGVFVAIGFGIYGFSMSHTNPDFSDVTNGVINTTGRSGRVWSQSATGPQKDYIQKRFGAGSLLDRIAWCESSYQQFEDSAGTTIPYRSKERGSSATGIFQVLAITHGPTIDTLRQIYPDSNFDITTAEGNANFAVFLLARDNTTPWNKSKDCWDGSGNTSPSTPSSSIVVGPEQKNILLPADTTVWSERIPSGAPSYGLNWMSKDDVSYIIRWNDGTLIHEDTMWAGNAQHGGGQYLKKIPQWIQMRILSPGDSTTVHVARHAAGQTL